MRPSFSVRCPANLWQWNISKLVWQHIWHLLTRLTCSLQCKRTGYHENDGPSILGLENKPNSDINVNFFISNSKFIPCMVQLCSPLPTSAYPTFFINRISIKIYTIFRRLSAINFICLLCHSWEIRDWNNQWSSQELLNQKQKSCESRVSVSGCTQVLIQANTVFSSTVRIHTFGDNNLHVRLLWPITTAQDSENNRFQPWLSATSNKMKKQFIQPLGGKWQCSKERCSRYNLISVWWAAHISPG